MKLILYISLTMLTLLYGIVHYVNNRAKQIDLGVHIFARFVTDYIGSDAYLGYGNLNIEAIVATANRNFYKKRYKVQSCSSCYHVDVYLCSSKTGTPSDGCYLILHGCKSLSEDSRCYVIKNGLLQRRKYGEFSLEYSLGGKLATVAVEK